MEFRPLAYLKKRLSQAKGGPVWRGGGGDMVLTLTENGEILAASASAGAIIGAAGNLVGRSFYDFVRREDRADVRQALARAAARRGLAHADSVTADFGLLRVRRSPAHAEIAITPAGRGFSLFGRQRGRLKALVRDRGDALARAGRRRDDAGAARASVTASPGEAVNKPSEAKDDMKARAGLIADLGHEMKTPLNAIMGFADAMRLETFGPLGDERYKEYAEHIHASGAHLVDLIGSILDYAKVEANRYQLAPALSDPGPIVRECAAMIRGEAEKAGLAFKVEIEPDLPEAMIDKRAVKQILINLLSNAVKFTEAGAITISVSQKCGALDFIVKDTGVGMNQVALAKLGGRFTDVHKDGVRGAGGAGLGLSLAFALAKLHGGALILDSAPGEGTTARLTLPMRRSIGDAPGAGAPSRPGDIKSQLDRVAQYRRERAGKADLQKASAA